MKLALLTRLLILTSAVSGASIVSTHYKDKSFLNSLEGVMRHTALEIGDETRKGVASLYTQEERHALYHLDHRFDEFYKTMDNDDQCCDKLLCAIVCRSNVLTLPYISTLFTHRRDLQERLERYLKPTEIKRLQEKYSFLKKMKKLGKKESSQIK